MQFGTFCQKYSSYRDIMRTQKQGAAGINNVLIGVILSLRHYKQAILPFTAIQRAASAVDTDAESVLYTLQK